MKKIDKLIIGSFLGPFFLTFFVVIFILLSQFMLKYLDEIVGKDLDTIVIVQLIFYFSIFMTPNAFPLAVLLSSLMTFGNLGEHFELTALKSSGISLLRVMVPIFVFAILLTGVAFYSNNYIVPKANLKAFSLLYDVKQMKPSMELKEGTFYNGIENYSIKVGEKFPDGKSLKDLVIYDHTGGQGNKHITLADSGRMYNILNDRYLVLELFNGHNYREELNSRRSQLSQPVPDPLVRNLFESQKVVFSLASFDMKRTKEELFSSNRLMKNTGQLTVVVDSMKTEFRDKTEEVKENSFQFFDYHLQDIVKVYKEHARQREAEARRKEEEKMRKEHEGDSSYLEARRYEDEMESDVITADTNTSIIAPKDTNSSEAINKKKSTISTISRFQQYKVKPGIPKDIILEKMKRKKEIREAYDKSTPTNAVVAEDSLAQKDSIVTKPTFEENMAIIDSILNTNEIKKIAYNRALTHVRYVKNNMMMRNSQLENLKTEINKYQLERYKKLSYAITILIMFFIGAPLGAIIKRGGLGVPVLISLSFFILFYVISMICEKWTRTDVMDPILAAWMANIILFPAGVFFMKQAKNDARLFETDFYSVVFRKVKAYIISLRSLMPFR